MRDYTLLPMKTPQPLGTRIRNARRIVAMSQHQLAQAVGVARTTVTMWESGRREPSLRNLRHIGDALRIPLEALVAPDQE